MKSGTLSAKRSASPSMAPPALRILREGRLRLLGLILAGMSLAAEPVAAVGSPPGGIDPQRLRLVRELEDSPARARLLLNNRR